MRECRAQLSDAVKVTTVGIFQFFPSCCTQQQLAGHMGVHRKPFNSFPVAAAAAEKAARRGEIPPFNSFPVAALREDEEEHELADWLSILSQLLPIANRGVRAWRLRSFQFFPSCCVPHASPLA